MIVAHYRPVVAASPAVRVVQGPSRTRSNSMSRRYGSCESRSLSVSASCARLRILSRGVGDDWHKPCSYVHQGTVSPWRPYLSGHCIVFHGEAHPENRFCDCWADGDLLASTARITGRGDAGSSLVLAYGTAPRAEKGYDQNSSQA
jgi:hypothetical protein